MVSKKAIIAVAVVAIVVVVIAVAASAGNDDDPADVRYDYTLEYADHFGDGYLVTLPDDGYTFLVVRYTLANDWDRNITTNPFYQVWSANLDGVVYQTDAWISAALDEHHTVEAAPGGQVSDLVVIQVPVGHDIGEFDISYEYDGAESPKVAHDDSLM